jgi:hypothetical protein
MEIHDFRSGPIGKPSIFRFRSTISNRGTKVGQTATLAFFEHKKSAGLPLDKDSL